VAKRGRPPVLDDVKQGQIMAIVSMGCSQRTAARYVGCAPSTILYTAEHNQAFAEKLEHARSQAVVMHMKNINSAAKKAQYWRAAAWALERLNPEDYAPPHADMLSTEQVFKLLAYLSQVIVEEVPIDAYRKNIMKRLGEMTKMVDAMAPEKSEEVVADTANNNDPENNKTP
jgi:hypothetical protein